MQAWPFSTRPSPTTRITRACWFSEHGRSHTWTQAGFQPTSQSSSGSMNQSSHSSVEWAALKRGDLPGARLQASLAPRSKDRTDLEAAIADAGQ